MRSPFPLGGRHQRTSGHLASCHECASAVRRERQYLERLRDAPIPPASDDLTARLLARTSELAAEPRPAAGHPARPRAAVRVLAMTAGGTVAAAGVLAVGAFAAAGEPLTGTDASAALSPVSSQMPADGRALSAEQVSMLRSEGWACPELEAMGFHLESAQAVVIDGQPAVHLRLSDGSHYATVTEQHPPARDAASRQDNALKILGSSPWSATYRTAGRTFTYESNLPAERADDALPILQRLASHAGDGVSAGTGGSSSAPEPLGTRLQRGINKMVARFTQ